MARAGFKDHPKFKRLVFLLKEPIPHVWGYLECLWEVSYQRRCDQIGDAVDVELNAQFPGETGKLVNALSDPSVRFLDHVGGVYYIHDLADYAPPYVKSSKKFRLLNPTDSRSSAFRAPTSRVVVDECATTSHTVRDQNEENPGFESPSALEREKSIEEGRGKMEEGGEEELPHSKTPSAALISENAEELAKRFVDIQAGRKESISKITDTIRAMIESGHDPGDFSGEIDKPPNQRDRSERFFEIQDRLKKARKKRPKVNDDDIFDREIKAQGYD